MLADVFASFGEDSAQATIPSVLTRRNPSRDCGPSASVLLRNISQRRARRVDECSDLSQRENQMMVDPCTQPGQWAAKLFRGKPLVENVLVASAELRATEFLAVTKQ
jgi:hypothetical protein